MDRCRPGRLPAGATAADHRGRGRFQQLPHPAWKAELAALANEVGRAITVCHLPPGTSKWNKIEHRLFCHIAMNWRGQPLTSHEVILESIAATTTGSGLRVHAELDTGSYPIGIEFSEETMATLDITRHDFHGDWNYTLNPSTASGPRPDRGDMPSQPAPRDLTGPDRHTLSHPALTGMPRQQLEDLTTELAAAQAAQREQQRHIRRGSERRRAPGAGPPPKLTPADRVLATVLYLRRSFPQPLLAQLFGVHRSQITRAIAETQKLLDHHATIASTARFHTPTDIVSFIANVEAAKIKPAS